MIDARTFPKTLDSAKAILQKSNAVFKGEYTIHDKIYVSKNPIQTLDKTFLRLRIIPNNIWSEKPVIVTIKNTELKKVGKESIIPVKKEFDNETEGLEFINKNYGDQFEFSFEFERKGWQYFIGEDGIDLEDIANGHYSIEFKSKTEETLKDLLELFGVKPSDVTKGPSVIAVKKILNL